MGHVDFKEEIVFRAAQIVSLVSFVALVTLFVLAAKGLLQTTSASPVILVSIAAVLVVLRLAKKAGLDIIPCG